MMVMVVLKAVLVGCVWVSVWPARCVCFSRGAGSSSCVDMKPGHISAQPPYTHSSVAIHTSSSIYLPQHTLMVSVRSSRAFMGLLLQARSVPEDRVVGGQFTLYPVGTHTLSCVSTADTVTHSNKRLKRNLSFSWRAPAQPSGDLRFYITVVHSYFVYWERIPSDLVYDGTRRNRSPVFDANRLIRMISASLMKPTDTSSVAPLFNSTQSINIYTNSPPTHTSPTHKETYLEAFKHLTYPHTSSGTHTTTTHTPVHTEPQGHVYTHPKKPPVRMHTYTTMPITPTHRSPPLTPHIHTSHTLPKKRLITPNSHTHEDKYTHILTKHQHHSGSFTPTTTATTHPDQQREAINDPSTPALTSHLHPPSPSFLKSSSFSISQLIPIPTPVQSPILTSVPASPPDPPPLPPSTLIPFSNHTTDLNFTLIPPPASIPTSNSISLQPLHSTLTPISIPTPSSIPNPASIPNPNSIPPPAPIPIPNSVPNPASIPTPNSIQNPASIPTPNSIPNPASIPTPNSIPPPASIPTSNSISLQPLHSTLTPISRPTPNSIQNPASIPTPNSIPNPASIPTPNSIQNPASIPTPNSIPNPASIPTPNSIPNPASNSKLTLLHSTPTKTSILFSNLILNLTPASTPNLTPMSTLSPNSISVPASTPVPTLIPILNKTTKPNFTLIPTPAPTRTPTVTTVSQSTNPNTRLNLNPTPTSVLIPISNPTTAPTLITSFSLTPAPIPPSSLISIPYSILASATTQPFNPASTQTSPPNATVIPVSIPMPISAPTSTSVPNYTSSSIPSSTIHPSSTTQTHLLTSTPLHSSTVPSSPHPDPSPALQRSLLNPLPDSKPREDQPQKDEGPSESSPPQSPREQPRAPEEKGVKPDLVPSHKASELGLLLLLGLSAGLGMAVAVGLRYLQRKHCRRRIAMSLGDQSHGNSGVIRVQECGDLVQVRRIRENSFLLLQAEYNLITAPGS